MNKKAKAQKSTQTVVAEAPVKEIIKHRFLDIIIMFLLLEA